MIRFDKPSRTLTIQLPSWRDRRWWWAVVLFVIFDLTFTYVDRPVVLFMVGEVSQGVYDFFHTVSKFGDSKYYLVPLGLILPFILAARQALDDGSLRRVLSWLAQAVGFVFVAIAGSGILVNILKGIIGRMRPRLLIHEDMYGFAPFTFANSAYNSMPSGHSDTAFVLATALGFFFPRLRLPLWGGAALVACSRVVITAHYPTDVIVGSIFGIFTTYWLRRWYSNKGWVFIRRHGQYSLSAPGILLGSKIRTFLFERIGLPDGLRGRLPK